MKNNVSGRENNFEKAKKKETDNQGVSYDYRSVMHYSANAFSRNGQPTIVPKVKRQTTREWLTITEVYDYDYDAPLRPCAGMVVLNEDGTPTFRFSEQRSTNLNISLALESFLSRIVNWRVMEDTTNDHQFIVFDIN